MLNISFSTILMAVLTTNLLLLILTFLFINKKIMVNLGHKVLMFFVILALFRQLIAFEYPFTSNVYFPEKISKVIAWVRHPRYVFYNYDIAYWQILIPIWIIGIFIFTFLFIKEFYYFRTTILAKQYSKEVSNEQKYNSVLTAICIEKKKKNNFSIFESSLINVPMIYGVRKPIILIPSSLQVDSKSLYYILYHEASHFFRHHLLIKLGLNIIKIIYWWNPASWLLLKQSDALLEMYIDQDFNGNDTSETYNYLNCLLNVAKSSLVDKPTKIALAFCNSKKPVLHYRFQMLVKEKTDKKNHVLNIVLVCCIFSIYVASYLFILEASYVPPEIEAEVITLTPENSYIIINENGDYDIYLYDAFIETTNTLEYYPNNIKIYQNYKEIINYEN